MAILYVAAEWIELEAFARMLTGLRKLKWPIDHAFEGVWEGRRVMLAANGAGPKLASQAVEVAVRAITVAELSSSRLEAVVSAGFCGAIDGNLRECQIVVAKSVLDRERNETLDCTPVDTEKEFVSGLIVSQDRIANNAEEKQLLQNCGAIAVDMESAGVAARAKRAGLPCCCIKVVSDRADESFPFDINAMRSSEGRIARGKIGIHALSHPSVVPRLFYWKRRAEDAARALGEFLVSCRIKSQSDTPVSE